MKRVSRKVRASKSRESHLHLVFTNPQHERDREAADRLRAAQHITIYHQPEVRREAFPNAAKFSQLAIFEGDVPKPAKEAEYLARLAEAKKDASSWVRDDKVKKDGTRYTRTEKGNGLKDVYFNFPPWYSDKLARLVEAGDPNKAVKIAMTTTIAVARKLQERTGYKLVGIALHPDQRKSLGFHIQFQTASEGQLLGRSATKTRGRKGLRLWGDAMLTVQRFAKYVDLPQILKLKQKKDYDDVAFDETLDTSFRSNFSPEELSEIDAAATTYSFDWLQRNGARKSPKKELEELRLKMDLQAKSIESLQKEVETLRANAAKYLKDGRGKAAKALELQRQLDLLRNLYTKSLEDNKRLERKINRKAKFKSSRLGGLEEIG